MKKTIAAIAACAALAMPAIAGAEGAMAGHDAMTAKPAAATMLCRPATAKEKPTAMLMDNKTPIVCKTMDAAMMMKGKGGPNLSAALTAEQVDAAWREYLAGMLGVPGGGGGG